ncbi:damage-inducible protein DinB [Oleomonas cavernae]|uniref:Damage-inducible protein DinB n=1 Tax=Oleomonas cavernae TaxID=2320859 RepID=A0A418WTF4_9PROT|nr:DinB family protein [Oleomonas cavernae]RJF94508.1 damage-inducible protein DinB [Oleomonas cavernae]
MDLVSHFRHMARNNAWSNERLLRTCLHLSDTEFAAERVGFFPSLQATLNHILIIDRFYVEGLEGGVPTYAHFENEIPCPKAADLIEAQRAVDRRLIALCDALDTAGLTRAVRLDRGAKGMDIETMGPVLAHLFVHQIHHRGQAHAMLSSTRVAPPQLDEYFLDYDAPLRDPDLRDFGLPPLSA